LSISLIARRRLKPPELPGGGARELGRSPLPGQGSVGQERGGEMGAGIEINLI